MKSYKIIKETIRYDNGRIDTNNSIEIYIGKDYFSYPIDINFIYAIDGNRGASCNISKYIKIQKIDSSKYIIQFLPSIIGEISSHKAILYDLVGLSIYSIIESKSINSSKNIHTIFTSNDIFSGIRNDSKSGDINVLNTLLNKGITCVACDNEE